MNRELEIKLARIRNMMAQKDLDAVYLKGQDNFAWLTCGGRNYVGMGSRIAVISFCSQGDVLSCGIKLIPLNIDSKQAFSILFSQPKSHALH